MKKAAVLISCVVVAVAANAAPVKIIFDTDMLTDFDDVGAIEVINHYYGRGDLPVGSPKGMGVNGSRPGAKEKVHPGSPLGEKTGGDGGH